MPKNKKSRIGIDCRMYRRATGGIGRYTHALVERLAKFDRKNRYYLFLTDDDLKEYDLKAKNFYPIRAPYSHYSIKEQTLFLRLLNHYHLDLAHFTNVNFPIFYRGKFIITIHDITMVLHPAFGKQSAFLPRFFYLAVLKRGIKKSQKIITDSYNTKRDLENIMQADKGKIAVIHLGVDAYYQKAADKESQIRLKEKYKISLPYLLFVSQWRPHKGIEKLVEAFEILNSRFKTHDLHLVITGKPNPNFTEIEERINSSPLRKRIITPGFIDENDMASLYSNAQGFIFPSIYEGFGLNPLEAMACGTAVATSNISSIPEVCGDAALYFDPQDPEDIALKTHTLLANNVLRQKLIENGFENVKRFSWDKMAKETYEVYKSALVN